MVSRATGWASLPALMKAAGTSAPTAAPKVPAKPVNGGWLSPAFRAPATATAPAANMPPAPAGTPQGIWKTEMGGGFRDLSNMRAVGAGSAPADPNAPWRPAALSNQAVPYPALGAAVGGGGGGFGGTFTYVPREEALGPGAYMPGNASQWKKDITDSFNSLAGARQHGNVPSQRYWELEAAKQRASGSAGARQLIEAINAEQARITGGGGGGGGGSGGGVGAANQANEARYQDILNGYQQRYERNLANLQNAGQQEAADINEAYTNQGSRINNDLISRGMRNSTVAGTMAQGNERERLAAISRLNERLQQQRLAVDAGLSKDTLDVMERKNEAGPDLALLAQLQRAASATGGLGGAVGGASFVPASALGFQNPLMWATQAMMQGAAGGGGGGNGFETSEERARRLGKPYFGPGNVPTFAERVALGLG